ncbi:MAG: NUDIX domain-containing protein [Alphaproteobacteria bacterium]|nr:NUDIX domain-containing protein [Alphaproteobacteria bacterium]
MEKLDIIDIYDQDGNHMGTEDRGVVHRDALWHKTVHAWVVRNRKDIVFQRRAKAMLDNPGKLYTTASGHVNAGETLEKAILRELDEEVGLNPSAGSMEKLFTARYVGDFLKTDGTQFRDRAFVEKFVVFDDTPIEEYRMPQDVLDGVACFNMRGLMQLFQERRVSLEGQELVGGRVVPVVVTCGEFLTTGGATCLETFGPVVEAILQKVGP